jgi:hypothetical protein
VGTNVGISHIPKGYVPVGKVVGMIIIVGTCTHHRSQVSTCMYDRRTDSQTHRGKIVYRTVATLKRWRKFPKASSVRGYAAAAAAHSCGDGVTA